MTRQAFWTKQKQIGLGLILLGILTVISIFITIQSRTSYIRGFAELIPKNEVAAYVEIDLHEEQNDFGLWKTLWGDERSALFEDAILPWWNKHAVFTLLDSPLYIFETDTPDQAKSTLEQHAKNFLPNFFLYRNYVFFSEESATIDHIKVFTEKPGDSLARSADFNEIFGNLPQSAMVKFYFSPENIPGFNLFRSFGGIAQISTKGPLVSATALFKKKPYPVPKKRYEAKLLKFFPESPDFFFAGENLLSHFAQDREMLKSFAINLLAYFQMPDVFSDEDLADFFDHEYALGAYINKKEKYDFLFITEINDHEKIGKLKALMPTLLAYIAPETRPVTLGDGTKAQEYFANPENIKSADESISGKTVTVFDPMNRDWNVLVSEINGLLLIATDRSLLEKTFSGENGFQQSDSYGTFSEVLRGVHEAAMAKNSFLQKYVELPAILKNFPTISVSSSYVENELHMYLLLGLK